MTGKAEAFAHWIRTSFIQMNTELENLYFAQPKRMLIVGRGNSIKEALRDEGHAHVVSAAAATGSAPNTNVSTKLHFRHP